MKRPTDAIQRTEIALAPLRYIDGTWTVHLTIPDVRELLAYINELERELADRCSYCGPVRVCEACAASEGSPR